MKHFGKKLGNGMRLAAAALASLALAGCSATSGPFGLSPEKQLALGAQEHPKIVATFGGEMQDPAINAYVEGIVERLLRTSAQPNAQIKTTVLDSPIVNAMALPGHVYVTRGLLALANSEAELAGVIGHEIGHVFEQHTAERVSRSSMAGVGGVLATIGAAILTGDPRIAQQTQQLVGQTSQLYLLRFSRDQEYEADQVGVRLLAQAGYDPLGEAQFLNTLNRWSQVEAKAAGRDAAPPEFLSSHPNTAKRVQQAAAEAKVLGKGGETARDRYLNRIDGLLYGDDPVRQGFVRGNEFYHPQLGFGFAVPQGMQLANTSQAVIARSESAQMQFTGARSENGPGPLVQQLGEQLKVQISQPQAFDANGKTGAYGRARANTQQGQVDVQIFAIQWDGPGHWVFLWVTPTNRTANLQNAIQQSVLSLRTVNASQLNTPPTLNVDVATVQSRDTFQSLAALNQFENLPTERFAVINGYSQESDVKAGKRVKIIR